MPHLWCLVAAFVQGCHKRMGDIIKPDHAVSLEIMHHFLKLVEDDWEHAPPQAKFKYVMRDVFIL
jgi:hypothetical protein